MGTSIVVVGADGRMGRTIVGIAGEEGSTYALAGVVDSPDRLEALKSRCSGICPVGDSLEAVLPAAGQAVIIDFSTPSASLAAARVAAGSGHGLVVGTTGLNRDQRGELARLAEKTPIFWASNMSVGVNALRRILPLLAKALGEDYDMEVMEIHHRHKKDSPSGTALALGETLADARGWNLDEVRCSGRDGLVGARPHRQIGVQALRGGDVVGVHTVYFLGRGERIEVTHHAHSRETFARGALRAAAWLSGQAPGKLYGMEDMLQS